MSKMETVVICVLRLTLAFLFFYSYLIDVCLWCDTFKICPVSPSRLSEWPLWNMTCVAVWDFRAPARRYVCPGLCVIWTVDPFQTSCGPLQTSLWPHLKHNCGPPSDITVAPFQTSLWPPSDLLSYELCTTLFFVFFCIWCCKKRKKGKNNLITPVELPLLLLPLHLHRVIFKRRRSSEASPASHPCNVCVFYTVFRREINPFLCDVEEGPFYFLRERKRRARAER